MKRTLYTLISLFLLISCQQEDVLTETGKGYLQFESLTLGSVTAENIVTRAVEDDLYIKISNGTDADKVYAPGEFPQTKVELNAGSYTFEAYNEAYLTTGADAPRYYARTNFSIESQKVSYIDLQVPMINVGISLAPFSDELTALFSNPTLTVYTTDSGATKTVAPGQTAYFDHTDNMTFTYTLTATNTDNETFTTTPQTYGNNDGQSIEPGHCYILSYSLADTRLQAVCTTTASR